MRLFLYVLIGLFFLSSCDSKPKEKAWVYSHNISVKGVNPIGIATAKEGFWLSDGDHFRVVKIDRQGEIIHSIDSLDRPMHIASYKNQLVIPQYGNDEVLRMHVSEADFYKNERIIISLKDSLDAPAGADIMGNEIAIADFYNNKVHYAGSDNKWVSFGRKGEANGEFYYPTDVQITQDALWVADAYNNRLQKFTKTGEHLLTIGEAQNMNAATGIYVSEKQVLATDFENNRVLIFDLNGEFIQELKEEINKPTDILIQDGSLYIANYKSNSLSVYDWGEIKDKGEINNLNE